jgi:hypothetical protein
VAAAEELLARLEQQAGVAVAQAVTSGDFGRIAAALHRYSGWGGDSCDRWMAELNAAAEKLLPPEETPAREGTEEATGRLVCPPQKWRGPRADRSPQSSNS